MTKKCNQTNNFKLNKNNTLKGRQLQAAMEINFVLFQIIGTTKINQKYYIKFHFQVA